MTTTDPQPPDAPTARALVRAADTAEILATTLLGLSLGLRTTGGKRMVEVCASITEQALAELPRMVRELADAQPDDPPPQDPPPCDLPTDDSPPAGPPHLPPLAAHTMPRLFYLYRRTDRPGGISGTGVVAVGIEVPEVPAPGPRVITIWRGLTSGVWNLSVWQSIEQVLAVHGHGDGTELHWLYRPPGHPVLADHPRTRKESSIP